MKKPNDIAKWIVIALAVGAVIYNTAVIHNEVKHNTKAIQEIRQDIKDMRIYFMGQK